MNKRDERFASLVDFIKEKAKALGYIVLDGIGATNSTIYLSGSFDVPVIAIYDRGINFYLNGLISITGLTNEKTHLALTRGSGATDTKWYCQYFMYSDIRLNTINYGIANCDLSFRRYLEWHDYDLARIAEDFGYNDNIEVIQTPDGVHIKTKT